MLAIFLGSVIAADAQSKVVDDWKLISYKFSQLNNLPIEGQEITLTADTTGGIVSGASGCNRYSSRFKFDDSGRLNVGPMTVTKMACPGPWMQFESLFLDVLKGADSFSFETGVLTITDVDTQNFFRFKRVEKPVILTWYVNKRVVDCVGVVKTKCLQIKENKDGEWQNFFGPIDGFEFKKDFFYILEIERIKRKDPAADQPAFIHRLVRIIKQTKKEKEL